MGRGRNVGDFEMRTEWEKLQEQEGTDKCTGEWLSNVAGMVICYENIPHYD